MAARWLPTTFPTLLLLAACGGASNGGGAPTSDADTTFVDEGADANAVETDTQVLVSSLVSSIESQTFGAGVKAIFLPQRCLAVENDASTSTATYTFDGCLGPNGLRGVSGTLVAKYAVTDSNVSLAVKGSAFAINGAADVVFTASATVTASASKRTMAWKAQISGDTAGKHAFSRADDFTITWTLGEVCFGLDGTSDGQVKNREIKTEVEDYMRCKRGCPEAGGKISITNVAKNKSVAISYDGTNRATYTNANGKESTFLLLCTP